jgi:hypothetical protein
MSSYFGESCQEKDLINEEDRRSPKPRQCGMQVPRQDTATNALGWIHLCTADAAIPIWKVIELEGKKAHILSRKSRASECGGKQPP